MNLKNPLGILDISHILALVLQIFSSSLTYLLTPLIVTFTEQTYKMFQLKCEGFFFSKFKKLCLVENNAVFKFTLFCKQLAFWALLSFVDL